MKALTKAQNLTTAVMLSAATMVANPLSVFAQEGVDCTGTDCIQTGANSAGADGDSRSLFGEDSIFNTITKTLLFLVGVISVIMLIVGGIRYVVSGGDQNAVTGAKNTILYAIIGIVVAFLAFAAVSFVTGSLNPQ